MPGSTVVSPQGTIIEGAGSDIWGTADSFRFVYQPFADGEIFAPNPTQSSTHPFAKVGLMIRMSLDPGSPHVILDVKPDGSFEFMTRQVQDGATTFLAGATGGTHEAQWRLIRDNGAVTAVVCGLVPVVLDHPCQTLGSTPFPSGMALAGAVVTSHDPSTLNAGFFDPFPTVRTVARPWDTFDVGNVGVLGDAFSDRGTFTVRGAGADIWGTTDSFRYVRNANTLYVDGEIVARVTSEDAAHPFAKAGVVLVTSDELVSFAHVILDVRPNGLIEFMARDPGQEMRFVAGAAASFPVWLKLKRIGDEVTGLMSPNGTEWQTVGVISLPTLPTSVEAGLAVTSHDVTTLNTSTFDHVLVATSLSPADVDIGNVGIAGERLFLVSSLPPPPRVGIQAGGGDIWGAADEFNYLYQSLFDDGQMIVRVDSLDNTHPFAKVGIMIRESLDPSAAHAMVDVTPSSLVEVLTRPSTGADTQWVGGLSPTGFPLWLKLTRTGGTIDAWASSDGLNFLHLTQAFPAISSDALIGVAVTSHNRGVLTTATFDSLSR